MTTDPFITALMERVKATTTADALRDGVMTLGSLRTALALLPPDTTVVIAGPTVTLDGDEVKVLPFAPPTGLASYRGYYERLSFDTTPTQEPTATAIDDAGDGFDLGQYGGWYQPGHGAITIAQPATTSEVIKALDLADGATFEGYKGGQYAMDSGTFLHHAPYGSTGTQIVGVELVDSVAVLLTAQEVW